jgi:hypothetical protein
VHYLLARQQKDGLASIVRRLWLIYGYKLTTNGFPGREVPLNREHSASVTQLGSSKSLGHRIRLIKCKSKAKLTTFDIHAENTASYPLP